MKITDDRTVFGKACLLLQVNMPFPYVKTAKVILTNEATMIGVETRTSAPVRITRDKETLQHVRIKGLFPCGEGAGYAGGIVSAGIDGERCAEAAKAFLG